MSEEKRERGREGPMSVEPNTSSELRPFSFSFEKVSFEDLRAGGSEQGIFQRRAERKRSPPRVQIKNEHNQHRQRRTQKIESSRETDHHQSDLNENRSFNLDSSSPGLFQTPFFQSNPPDSTWSVLRDPHLLSGYFHLAVNVSAFLFVCLLIYFLCAGVYKEIELKVDEYSREIAGEIQRCARDYIENKCDLSQRPRALEKTCHDWQVCKERNPLELGWAKISFRTFAEIIDNFVEPISIKTSIFILSLIIVIYILSRIFSAASSRVPPPSPIHHQPLYTVPGPQFYGVPYNPYPTYSPPPSTFTSQSTPLTYRGQRHDVDVIRSNST